MQVRDTRASGSITLRSANARAAIADFVDLVDRNPKSTIDLHYLTTSEIGREKDPADRLGAVSGLEGWRQAAKGGEMAPLRRLLESGNYPEAVRSFVRERDDGALRRDLLQRIHWECGRPEISALRRELEERLVVLARDRFSVPAQEARGLADILIHHTLCKSILKSAEARVLTRADLYEVIDGRTRVSLPRAVVDDLMRLIPGFEASHPIILTADPFFIEGATLAAPRGLLPKRAVESRAMQALRETGTSILVGGSGLGKSAVALSMLQSRDGSYAVVEFRDEDRPGMRRRLDATLARLGNLVAKALVLEDVDHLEEAGVASALGRLLAECRQRGVAIVMTTSRSPSTRVVVEMGVDRECVLQCPYFSQTEVEALVTMHGGNAARWGRLAYVAGAAGHPQITHAFVVGMAARGWPSNAIVDVVSRGLTSEDVDAARESARRAVAAALPGDVRTLLYRLSLANMRFDRALVLAIGSLPPVIPRAAECFDELVGPWIENAGMGLHRVSPLAASFGRDMLPAAEKTTIHGLIAEEILGRENLDVGDADAILMHALAGESERALTALAYSVMTATAATLDLIAEHASVLALMRTDRLIFPRNPTISSMLRLAQFKLTAASGDEGRVAEVARVLLSEGRRSGNSDTRSFEAAALATILGTQGAANFIDDWVDLLQRFKRSSATDHLLHKMRTDIGGEDLDLFGVLFAVGTSGLRSIERLEHVIDGLGRLLPEDRAILLAPAQERYADHTLMILGPYASRHDGKPFDAKAAIATYARIARKTSDWSPVAISIQCRVAQAVILDEDEDDEEAALAVLDEAQETFGDEPSLLRERAKIHWRRRRYPLALETIRGVIDTMGRRNVVDRAFGLREAAISAAHCGEGVEARTWFVEAANAADVVDVQDMHAMAAGLRADAAVVAFRSGDLEAALSCLKGAMLALERVDPKASLLGAHCHRLVRHAALWAQDRVDGGALVAKGALADLEPGACSNPSPSPDVERHPLSRIGLAWYVLAGTEIALGLDLGIVDAMRENLKDGPIPIMEAELRSRLMTMAIERCDPARFAAHMRPYVEAVAYMRQNAELYRRAADASMFECTRIPKLPPAPPFAPHFEAVGRDAIIAFAIKSGLAGDAPTLEDLGGELACRFPSGYPGQVVLEPVGGAELAPLDRTALDAISALRSPVHLTPSLAWIAALRLFERANHSAFSSLLIPSLAAWLHRRTSAFVAQEAFRLSRPHETVPPILCILGRRGHDQAYVARLLLVIAPAVGSPLSQDYATSLAAIAARKSGPAS